jgi:hypothetical protein
MTSKDSLLVSSTSFFTTLGELGVASIAGVAGACGLVDEDKDTKIEANP